MLCKLEKYSVVLLNTYITNGHSYQQQNACLYFVFVTFATVQFCSFDGILSNDVARICLFCFGQLTPRIHIQRLCLLLLLLFFLLEFYFSNLKYIFFLYITRICICGSISMFVCVCVFYFHSNLVVEKEKEEDCSFHCRLV